MVNGAEISRRAMLDVVQALVAQRDDIPDDAAKAALRKQALASLVDFELLYQESQRRNLDVSNDAVAAAIKVTESSFESPKAYRDALAAKGLSRQDIERDTRKTLAVNRVLEEAVWADIKISEDAIRQFYDEHPEEFRHPGETRASHILIRVQPGATPAQRSSARAEAEALVQRARAGEAFESLARAASQDPATAGRGGDLGYFPEGTMVKPIEQAAAALDVGQTSGVVETSFGFHVVKVTGRRPAGLAPLDEIRARIVAVLTEEAKLQRQDQFVAGLRQKADIQIAPDLQ